MKKILRRFRTDRGAALPMIAGMLVALLGLTALAVDLGWFYLNASRIQRTADAAALAGVIRMPDDFATATVDAVATARTNGYTHGVNADVLVEDVASDPNQLDVTVTATVDTFFAQILGIDDMTIRRRARGEFIPPLRLGSPSNLFGNTCDPGMSGGCGPNFWANIHGRHTDTVMGDAFSSACRGSNGNPGCTSNAFWRERGYLYGIDANGAASFTVEFLDLAFHNISGSFDTSDGWRTGDRGCEDWGNDAASCGPTMYVALYAPDPDPLDVSNNALLCDATIPPQAQVDETAAYVFSSPAGCFTVSGPESGTYVLQVKVLDSGGNDDGLNRYSVRSSAGTSLFGLGDFSIYNNASGTATEFYLAEVRDYYAGKTFVVELYDAGESSAAGNLQVIDPTGNIFNDGACRIYDRTPPADWVLQSTPASCQENVTPGEYNGRWLKFEMDIPSTYSCGGSCWWKMNYAYPSGVNDTTTWRAYIVGNPIHLVPSGA